MQPTQVQVNGNAHDLRKSYNLQVEFSLGRSYWNTPQKLAKDLEYTFGAHQAKPSPLIEERKEDIFSKVAAVATEDFRVTAYKRICSFSDGNLITNLVQTSGAYGILAVFASLAVPPFAPAIIAGLPVFPAATAVAYWYGHSHPMHIIVEGYSDRPKQFESAADYCIDNFLVRGNAQELGSLVDRALLSNNKL